MSSLENMTDVEREAQALRLLFNHPEVGMQAKRLYKKAVPDAKFPELDIDDKIRAERDESSKQIRELNDKLVKREIEDARGKEHDKLRARGLDPERVEKVMTEKNIANYETAASYVEMEAKIAPPTPASVTPISLPDDFKKISANPRGWAREQAFKAVDEMIAKRTA